MTTTPRLAGIACAVFLLADLARAAPEIDIDLPLIGEWKIAHQQKAGINRIVELVPRGDSVHAWTQKVTFVSSEGVKTKPGDLFAFVRRGFEELCPVIDAGQPRLFQVAGFDALLGSIGCGTSLTQPEGEYTTFLYIRGRLGMYQVLRAWKGRQFAKDEMPLSPRLQTEWKHFFENVGICTPAKSGERDCVNIPKS